MEKLKKIVLWVFVTIGAATVLFLGFNYVSGFFTESEEEVITATNESDVEGVEETEEDDSGIEPITEEERIGLILESFYQEYAEQVEAGAVLNSDEKEYVRLDDFLYEPMLESGKDRVFFTAGQLELSNYYNYGYSNVKQDYQSFKLVDYKGNIVHVYGLRDREDTQQLIDDVHSNQIDTYYFNLEEKDGVDTGTSYMAVISSYMNPFMDGYEE